MRLLRIAARATAIAFTLTFGAQLAIAAPRPEATPVQLQAARELFADATKDEEGGRWALALEKLHRVADVKLTAGIRYHIALCEERLGQTATALSHYTEALQAARDEKNKEVAELLKDPFLTDLRARVPSITVNVSMAGASAANAPAGNANGGAGAGDTSSAEVLVDGQIHPAGLWGVPVPIDPGVHRVEAHAPGRRAFSTVVTVNDRDRSVIAVTLPPLQSAPLKNAEGGATAPPPGATPIGGSTANAPATHDAATSDAVATATPRNHASRGGAIAATAGAIVLAGGGVAAYLVAGSKQSDAQNECRALVSCDDRKGAIQTFDALALGAWIGAAALGVTAVVLWSTPSHSDHAEGPAPRVLMGVGPGSLRLEGSF